MDKKTAMIVFIIALITFAISMFLIKNYIETMTGDSLGNFIKTGGYVNEIVEVENKMDFDDEVLDNTGKVLVDFYADWCGPCKSMEPILEKIAKENADIKIVKVNVDENANLAMEYGAMSIPLFVFFNDGIEIDRVVGAVDEEYLLEMMK